MLVNRTLARDFVIGSPTSDEWAYLRKNIFRGSLIDIIKSTSVDIHDLLMRTGLYGTNKLYAQNTVILPDASLRVPYGKLVIPIVSKEFSSITLTWYIAVEAREKMIKGSTVSLTEDTMVNMSYILDEEVEEEVEEEVKTGEANPPIDINIMLANSFYNSKPTAYKEIAGVVFEGCPYNIIKMTPILALIRSIGFIRDGQPWNNPRYHYQDGMNQFTAGKYKLNIYLPK